MAKTHQQDSDTLDFPIAVQLSDLPDCSNMQIDMTTDLHRSESLKKLEKKSFGTRVRVNCVTIALFRFGTTVYAIEDACPHLGGPLHLGDIENLISEDQRLVPCIVCPWHRWTFRLDNGQRIRKIMSDVGDLELIRTTGNFTIHGACGVGVKLYTVLMDSNENLYIRFHQFDSKLFSGKDICL
ncbi:Rieske domain-containing protein [Trichoplax sp. H2]|nr:Rieske domain-containing protein [Trichoplax sp. H2]|eukprot:RDD39164.1 Rieske domain-containing protein [Trichoplax sp. H2]